jgi:hypothetical protein
VVVVTYNSEDHIAGLLDECESIATRCGPLECILVDCCSWDETKRLVERWTTEHARRGTYTTVWLDKNVGFPVAANRGARRTAGRTILFLNPDVSAFVDAAIGVDAYLQQYPHVGACGPILWRDDGVPFPESARPLPSSTRLLLQAFGLGWISNQGLRRRLRRATDPIFPAAISGAFMAVRRDVIDQVGYLDERLFMYLEDVEYCRRLADWGYRVACLPWLGVRHAAGSSRRSVGNSATVLDLLAGEVPWILAMDQGRRWQARLATLAALVLAARIAAGRHVGGRDVAIGLVRWALGSKPRYVGWQPRFTAGGLR